MSDKKQNALIGSDFNQELRKITWPTKDTAIKAIVLVISIMIFSTIFVGGLDILYTKLFVLIRGLK
jgi:preprotein translocase SecE subunit